MYNYKESVKGKVYNDAPSGTSGKRILFYQFLANKGWITDIFFTFMGSVGHM